MIYLVNIIEAYLEKNLSNNKLLIFIKLSLKMYKLWHIRKTFFYKLLRSLYSLKQSEKL